MILQGAGFSLRSRYFSDFLTKQQSIDWLEILADQLIGTHGILLEKVQSITTQYPSTLHAVSLNIAGTDPLDIAYLKQIKALSNTLNPVYVSDHCCWVAEAQRYAHDLMPFPYDLSLTPYIASRINQIQNILQQPLLLENLSHYVNLTHACSEADLLNALCEQTGCGILLDINNVYVSSQNRGFDPYTWLKTLKPEYIKQCHLAGHIKTEQRCIDTHSQPVSEPVWQLFQYALKLFGAVPTCLEWDNDLPSWQVCVNEIKKIKAALNETHSSVDTLAYTQKQIQPPLTPPTFLKNFQQQTLNTILQAPSIADDDGWSVHQNSYRIQRMKALQQVFGHLELLLGKDYWQQLCLKTVLQYPSTSADITAEFENFITLLQQEINETKHPIVDFARYCWCWYQSFHQAALEPGALEKLQQTLGHAAEHTVFKLSPKVKLLAFNYPIESLWIACQPESQDINPTDILAELPEQACFMLFYQQQQKVHTRILDQASFDGLQCLRKPITLVAWAQQAENIEHLDPNAFAQWYAEGLITIKELT